MNAIITALIEVLESEADSIPEGFELESTTYTVTITLQSALERANMVETV